jgi:hypothetical protein
MAGEMVGVRVCLDRADDSDAPAHCLGEHGLDRIRGIDDRCDAGVFVSHEIARTAQVVVQELVEDHGPTVAPRPAMDLEVAAGGETAGRRDCRR